MKESATYQAILDEGFVKGKREGRQEGIEEGEISGTRKTLLRVA